MTLFLINYIQTVGWTNKWKIYGWEHCTLLIVICSLLKQENRTNWKTWYIVYYKLNKRRHDYNMFITIKTTKMSHSLVFVFFPNMCSTIIRNHGHKYFKSSLTSCSQTNGAWHEMVNVTIYNPSHTILTQIKQQNILL